MDLLKTRSPTSVTQEETYLTKYVEKMGENVVCFFVAVFAAMSIRISFPCDIIILCFVFDWHLVLYWKYLVRDC